MKIRIGDLIHDTDDFPEWTLRSRYGEVKFATIKDGFYRAIEFLIEAPSPDGIPTFVSRVPEKGLFLTVARVPPEESKE